jgi:hypothetical protein
MLARMNCRFALPLLLVGIVGCGHKVTDTDLVGTWNVDPAALKDQASPAGAAQMSFDLTADHHYSLNALQGFSVNGTWKYQDQKLTLNPLSLAVDSPFEPGKKMEVPIGPALEKAQELAKTDKNADDPQMLEAMRETAEPSTFDVSADGKKLSEAGKPALLKAETKG